MSGMVIDQRLCTGCGLCQAACPSGAISVGDTAQVDASRCTLCGLCVDACPSRAIAPEKRPRGQADLSAWRGVWVFAQQEQGRPIAVVPELLEKGRALADSLKEPLAAVLLGGGPDALSLLERHGADVIYHCADSLVARSDEETCLPVLARLVEEYKPSILLFGATPFGRSLAPRLAARLKTGLTADCTGLSIDPETRLLRQTRPAFGGNLMATIVCAAHRPQMATVRPGVFPVGLAAVTSRAKVIPVPGPGPVPRLVRLLAEQAGEAAESVASAPFILSVGRGIGNQKNLALAQKLAGRLGAYLGASRPLVEAGWLPYRHQIGQTGCSVAPRLLIALGISGAIQHLAGLGGAACVVAVNSDPDAPIFGAAHYAVVGDCQEILRELLAATE